MQVRICRVVWVPAPDSPAMASGSAPLFVMREPELPAAEADA